MIKPSQLADIDKSLTVIDNRGVEQIIGISPLKNPLEGSVLLVKSNRYFKRINFEGIDKLDNCSIIIEKSFYNSLSSDALEQLSSFKLIATVESFEKCICSLSKYFYDQKYSGINLFLDGRKLNSVEIDPNAEIAESVFIGDGVKIAEDVKIYPGARIMAHTKIGAGSIIHPNVVLYPFTSIGRDSIIHSNTSIGTDGFGYNYFDSKHNKVWHYAGVEIGDNVEIGSSTCIDSGIFSPTLIKNGTKIDNLVQIAHNIEIGENVIICGQTGMGGSAVISDLCVFGAKAGVGPDVHLPKGVQVAGNAQVTGTKEYTPGSTLAGHPARDINEWMKAQAFLRKEALKKR